MEQMAADMRPMVQVSPNFDLSGAVLARSGLSQAKISDSFVLQTDLRGAQGL